ncbi:MAG: hypothetical protein ACI9UK_000679 [Candidatus Krumholzibacteriia bacterium]|jgi:hypothetical protein
MSGISQATKTLITWPRFFKWLFVIYAISLFGVFLKIYIQEGGRFIFQNYAQVIAVSLIPLMFMMLTSPIFLVGFAYKRFKIQNTRTILGFTVLIYSISLLTRLLSSQPL